MKSYAKFMHVDVTILDCHFEVTYDGQQDKEAFVSSLGTLAASV